MKYPEFKATLKVDENGKLYTDLEGLNRFINAAMAINPKQKYPRLCEILRRVLSDKIKNIQTWTSLEEIADTYTLDLNS